MTGLREDEREAIDTVRHSLGNIGHLKAAQRDLVALGVDWAAAADVLGKVQREYVRLVNDGLDGIEAILAARAAQTDAATALDEVLERLSERREEEWGNYIGGPGGHVEALLQGRFDGLVVACAIVRELRAALTSEPQP